MSPAPRQGLLRPLAGTTVVDLSQQLPGPFATLLLRTLGARVVKVEPPGGDVARRIDPEMFRRMAASRCASNSASDPGVPARSARISAMASVMASHGSSSPRCSIMSSHHRSVSS